MPDKDITLGEVYRAVLSLKEEFVETRKEILEGHNALRDEVQRQSLAQATDQAKIKFLEARVYALEQTEPQKNTDPMARAGVAIGAGLSGLLSWWLSRGGQ